MGTRGFVNRTSVKNAATISRKLKNSSFRTIIEAIELIMGAKPL
jgi:hypothetical protein